MLTPFDFEQIAAYVFNYKGPAMSDDDQYDQGYNDGRKDAQRPLWIIAAVAYAVAGFLTFAEVYETSEKYDFAHGPGAVIAGAGWPVYWGGAAALKARKKDTTVSTSSLPIVIPTCTTNPTHCVPSTQSNGAIYIPGLSFCIDGSGNIKQCSP